MPVYSSINGTFYGNETVDEDIVDGVAIRAATLVLMQCFIIPGNALVLAAIASFSKRSVSDILIGCLALIDLVNGLGPVNISISMYYIGSGGFHQMQELHWLCLLYTWMSSSLRLMACFVATLMAMDRFAAIVIPFFYRTRLTLRAIYLCLAVLFTLSVTISTIPIAVEEIRSYTPLCSFDFTSPYAAFIAGLGYLQLVIVVLCYLSVMVGVNAFLSRQSMIRAMQIRASIAASKSRNRENTLGETSQVAVNKSSPARMSTKTPRHLSVDRNIQSRMLFRNSSLVPSNGKSNRVGIARRSHSLTPLRTQRGSLARILVSNKITRSKSISVCPEIKINTDICYIYTDEQGTAKRGSDFEIIEEAMLESDDEEKLRVSLKQFKRNNATWQRSRQLAIVMGIVVTLFYISWMPIVVISFQFIINILLNSLFIILYCVEASQ